MSIKSTPFSSNGLCKTIDGNETHMYKSFDLIHGYGWFVHLYDKYGFTGFGFSKKSRFTAMRLALKDLEEFKKDLLSKIK